MLTTMSIELLQEKLNTIQEPNPVILGGIDLPADILSKLNDKTPIKLDPPTVPFNELPVTLQDQLKARAKLIIDRSGIDEFLKIEQTFSLCGCMGPMGEDLCNCAMYRELVRYKQDIAQLDLSEVVGNNPCAWTQQEIDELKAGLEKMYNKKQQGV